MSGDTPTSLDSGPEPRELGDKDGASFQVIVLVCSSTCISVHFAPLLQNVACLPCRVAKEIQCSVTQDDHRDRVQADLISLRDLPAGHAKTTLPAFSCGRRRPNGARVR
jgi:hypothetical protein